jgi:hypothetical protein
VNKIRERARLLKAFEQTGDEDWRRAAECLRLPLLDEIKLSATKANKGRGRGAAGRTARPRLFRICRAVAAGETVYAAARSEVAEHGYDGHASEAAAVDYLRARYREDGEAIKGIISAVHALHAHWQEFDRQSRAIVADLHRAPVVPLQSWSWPGIFDSFEDSAAAFTADLRLQLGHTRRVVRGHAQPGAACSAPYTKLEKYPPQK